MAKLKPKSDDFARSDGGLYLPKYGLRGPDRLRPSSRRFMGRRKCCCSPTCPNCSDQTPSRVRVTISGLTTGSCGDCFSLNGTYDLDWWDYAFYTCSWYKVLASSPCGYNFLDCGLHSTGFLAVAFTIGHSEIPGTTPQWSRSGISYCQWNELSLTWISGNTTCYGVAPTCAITAL